MTEHDDPRDQTPAEARAETAGGPLEDPQTHLDTDPVNRPDDQADDEDDPGTGA